ncbi:MAG: LON peptidase substrate-binding domain-containing protein, partial [Ectothiorhodospiraceae bacterium]|nr:LON peptidase substrate-binding domain-containing protein [Ectothiorhodospiraceae bacterium]
MSRSDQTSEIVQESITAAPVLPLRDVVVYPHMVIPLFVGREKSIKALEAAMDADKKILLLAQKSADVDDPGEDDLYRQGTVATILQMLKLPDGTVKVLVEGLYRAQLVSLEDAEDFLTARLVVPPVKGYEDDREVEVLARSVMSQFDQYVKLNKKVPPEILSSLASIDDPGRLADTIAAHMALKIEGKQTVLEIDDVRDRLEHLLGLIEGEIDILQIEKRIRGRVKQQMEKSQREYYLNEQAKAIQKELGDLEDVPNETEELEQKIEQAGMPKECTSKAKTELRKLQMMQPMSAEATVVRNSIDWLVSVPWKKRPRVRLDLKKAEQVLDADHYGLEKVKERILES